MTTAPGQTSGGCRERKGGNVLAENDEPKTVTLHNIDGETTEANEVDLADLLGLDRDADPESYDSIMVGFFGFERKE